MDSTPCACMRFEHLGRLDRVRSEVLLGIGDRLGDLDVAREMHDRVAARQHGVQDGLIAHGSLDELRAGINGSTMAALQRVEHHARVAGVLQDARRYRTDVPGSAGDENAHRLSLRW